MKCVRQDMGVRVVFVRRTKFVLHCSLVPLQFWVPTGHLPEARCVAQMGEEGRRDLTGCAVMN